MPRGIVLPGRNNVVGNKSLIWSRHGSAAVQSLSSTTRSFSSAHDQSDSRSQLQEKSRSADGKQEGSKLAQFLCKLQARMPNRNKDGKEVAAEDSSSNRTDPATLTRLFSLAQPEARALSFALASLVVTTGVSLVFPAAVGHILDSTLAETPKYTGTQVHGNAKLGLVYQATNCP